MCLWMPSFQTVATTLQQVRSNLSALAGKQVSAGRGRLQTVFRLSATDIENHLLVRIPNLQAAEAALLDDRILVDGTFALEGVRQLHFKTVNSLQQPDETHLALTVEQMWLNDVAIAPELVVPGGVLRPGTTGNRFWRFPRAPENHGRANACQGDRNHRPGAGRATGGC